MVLGNGLSKALELVAEGADRLLPYLQNQDLRQDLVVRLVYQVAKKKSEIKDKEIRAKPWLKEHKWLATGMKEAMRGYLYSKEKVGEYAFVTSFWNLYENRSTENLETMAYLGGCMLRQMSEEEGIKSH